MLLRLALASCVTAVLLTAAASPALAGTREKILQECQNGRLTGDYTAKEIRDARNHIPTDIDQYSDCRDVLARALASRAGGGGGGGGAGGDGGGLGGPGGGGGPPPAPPRPPAPSPHPGAGTQGREPRDGGGGTAGGDGPRLTPSSRADQSAIAKAQTNGDEPVKVGPVAVVPGAAGLAAGAPRSALPAGIIAVLVLLGIAALAAAAPLVR